MFRPGYKQYVLGTLTGVYTLNFIDRNVVALLLQPIKEDLHLSDTQLGFVTGIAFGLFYATLGLPMARWADRGDRVTITSLAIGLWGVMVMCCLLVSNFVQLVAARIAAAIGEAGCMPPTYSLLGDYFPAPAERTCAMTVYWLASPLSALISFIMGGFLNQRYGWRATLFLMGIPGLFAAVLVKLTVVEPRALAAGSLMQRRLRPPLQPPIFSILTTLWRQRSSRHLTLAIVLLWTMGLGLGPWYAAFMIRSHGMGTAELGVWFGLIFGSSGVAGVMFGGYAANRWFAHNERGQVRLCAVMAACIVPCFAAFLSLPGRGEALTALVPLLVVFSAFLGPTFALMQRLVTSETRATTLAVLMLLANLIGMGIGPELVGMLSDLLNPVAGRDSLRYAMLAVSLVALWAAYHLWQVSKTVTEDLSAVRRSCRMNMETIAARGGPRECALGKSE